MSIDTTTPRSRRALLAGAIGGALASIGLLSKPEAVRAGVDGDVVLDATNTGAGTTEIDSTTADPAVLVTGGATGLLGRTDTGVGLLGASAVAVVDIPDPIAASTGVYGISTAGHGVYGASDTGIGVYAANNSSTKAAIVAEGEPGTAIHGHANAGPVPNSPGLTGLYGSAALTGVAIAADSANGLAVRATSTANAGIRGRGAFEGVIGESSGGATGVVGFSGAGTAPSGPAKTGIYGEATQDSASRGVYGKTVSGQGVRGEATTGVGVQGVASTGAALRGDAATGFAVDGTSTGGSAVRGNGGLDGVIGQSAGNRSGVVGFSGGTAPAGQPNTGVYGEANQDATARGVFGKSSVGQAVRGETTTGIGVQAVATTGVALAVTGRLTLNRSGKVTVPIGVTSVDVTVTGGLAASAIVFATLQYSRSGVWVTGARPNWPSAGKVRIYLNKALATATPVAWMVVG